MSQPRICPNCRSPVPADAPAGVCPACALRAGFDVETGADAPTRTLPEHGAPPMSVAELARRLPELEVLEPIGRGGMGAVYRARHRELDRPVAVKVLDAALADHPAFADRFAREARTLAQLDHPNVVKVFDYGQRDGLCYLTMELVDGVNLRQLIDAGQLRPDEALAMVPRICDALQYAHDQGVVHRDIKPENILVDRTGAIKIADFGLAKLAGDPGRRLTRTEQIMGTPHYMAPEQLENTGAVDHRADIFSLGVVFYELLTGELPMGRFPPPSEKVQVDVRIDDVVLRTLEKEPRLRYQQASELRTDVESVSSGAAPAPAAAARTDYEYRSDLTVFGWPLVHIASSRDPEGKRVRVARGVIAIGDVAIGGVAVGALAVGGVTFGGGSVGLVSFGGIALAMLTAIGGIACGGHAFGGLAFGLVAQGALPVEYLSLTGAAVARTTLVAWLVSTLGFTIGAVAAGYAWTTARRGSGPGGE